MADLPDARTLPLDEASRAALAERGLEYRLLRSHDGDAIDAHSSAWMRGFAAPEAEEEHLRDVRETMAGRRLIGVYDARGAQAHWPVATVSSWITPVTIPGGELPMWAISTVTVAATHRRRGIARALLEAELRDAHAAGVPIAGLTASEATIYGRYGFAPATQAATWKVDTRRVRWAGPEAPGRIEYIDREAAAALMGELHERTRLQRLGEVPGWPRRWLGHLGLVEKKDRAVRAVRYLDAAGEPRGVLAYKIDEDHEEADADLTIRFLVADGDEAVAALWRFAIEHDLVGTVTAPDRPVDEPLPWLVSDPRVPTSSLTDHGWLRIVDVPAVLEARAYAGPVDLVLRVADPLGYADGAWRVEIADGRATVTEAAGAGADVELTVQELSAAYLGGVSLAVLRAAGRVRGSDAAIAALDLALRVPRAPFLSIVY
ncbi:GNAT family N-acetyltransferase [Microbacterium album]|uniref:UPF0256 protein n=1 Tax=Microbacterium album TaxID=2053191 RepID=A0A917IGI7_9MICO|nr:GNAT family N-acetyltransferase [Microbacterium album]GGH47595.1 UPF0256 protein [Microbacterium album]